jgi:hypothetical protein
LYSRLADWLSVNAKFSVNERYAIGSPFRIFRRERKKDGKHTRKREREKRE